MLCGGHSKDPLQIHDSRKTAMINLEIKPLKIGIAALQETRFLSSGSLRKSDYTIFWQRKHFDENWLHDVEFAVRKTLLPNIVPPSCGTERILPLRFTSSKGPVTLLSIYVPTLKEKDAFYEKLKRIIENVSKSDHLYLLGDLNASVGGNHDLWP